MAVAKQIAPAFPIGNEWIRTDRMDTVRLPFDGSGLNGVYDPLDWSPAAGRHTLADSARCDRQQYVATTARPRLSADEPLRRPCKKQRIGGRVHDGRLSGSSLGR
jgi:hypothetical protein